MTHDNNRLFGRVRARLFLILASLLSLTVTVRSDTAITGNTLHYRIENATGDEDPHVYVVETKAHGSSVWEVAGEKTIADGASDTINVAIPMAWEGEDNMCTSGVFPLICQVRVVRDGESDPEPWSFPYRDCEGTLYYNGTEGHFELFHLDTVSGGGGDGGGGMTLDQFLSTATDQHASLGMMAEATKPTETQITDTAATARDTLVEKLTGPESAEAPTLGYGDVEVPSAASSLTVTVPHVGVVSFDPMDVPEVAAVLPWIYDVTKWVMTVAFAWFAWSQFAEAMLASGAAQQAKGNTIAGTGGQITALIASGLILVVIVAVPAAFWALSAVDLTPLSSNPFASPSGAVETALYLLGLVVPYDYLLFLLATAFVIAKGRIVIVAGVQTVVRAIVP